MSHVFSAGGSLLSEENASHRIELQLIPDEELMDIWEQTQKAVWLLEDKGWDPAGALHYCDVLVWEMQRRLAGRPMGKQFGTMGQALDSVEMPTSLPHIMTMQF